MPNPFLFGKIVTDKHFCNREQEQQLIADNVLGGQSIVVISPRRIGKSSLLAVVSSRLEKKGMVCGRIDFFALNSINKILGETVRVCAQMMLNQETNLKKFLSTAADVFKRTRIAIEPTPDGNVSIKPEVGLPADIRTSLSEAILGLDQMLGNKRRLMMFIVHVFVHVKTQNIEDFKAASIQNARESIKEPGVARFDVIQQKAEPTRFVLLEVYRTSDDPARHKETAHYQKWRDTVADMMAEPRNAFKYTNIFPDEQGWG